MLGEENKDGIESNKERDTMEFDYPQLERYDTSVFGPGSLVTNDENDEEGDESDLD